MGHRTDKTKKEDPTTDQQAHRNPNKTNDYKGEAQDVNYDNGRPLNEQELDRSRNKATEGVRQNSEKNEG